MLHYSKMFSLDEVHNIPRMSVGGPVAQVGELDLGQHHGVAMSDDDRRAVRHGDAAVARHADVPGGEPAEGVVPAAGDLAPARGVGVAVEVQGGLVPPVGAAPEG